MSTEHTVTRGSSVDDVLMRFGRWLLAKVWIGCLLSGGYAVGRHFGWPQALLTAAGVLGAVALALVVAWLPIWTRERTTGVFLIDVGMRATVWTGLVLCVVALLIGMPAVGTVAGALLLTTAWRTFHAGPSAGEGRFRLGATRPWPAERVPETTAAARDVPRPPRGLGGRPHRHDAGRGGLAGRAASPSRRAR